MPTQFQTLGINADVQEKEVVEFFDENDVVVYNETYLIDPLELNVYNQSDFGLPGDQLIEFQFKQEYGATYVLEIRHLEANLWGWWYAQHVLIILEPYASTAGVTPSYGKLYKEQLLLLWDEGANASYYECGCSHVSMKVFVATYNQSWTLSESWDNGKLKLYTTYEIDWENTGVSMWHVMMQIIAFDNPDLGIPGTFGYILGLGFSGALWGGIAILIFALITSVIPTVSGWRGG